MKKSRLLGAVCGCFIAFSMNTNASLVISNLNITSSNINFDVTGTVDIVGAYDLDSLFFGEVGGAPWINSVVFASGFSKNSGTYDFSDVGGAVNNSGWGTYLFTNGSDTLVVGDVVDISYAINGSFNPGIFDANNFVVQAGANQPESSIIQPDLITGGVNVVPLPTALWLFGSGLLGLIGIARKKAA